jgi:hypothetical protein
MRPRVLWIEDSARLELRHLAGPIYISGKYDFYLAEDVTVATDHLLNEEFDAVIVDIRLPPGTNRVWRELYYQKDSDKVKAELGLKLLTWLVTGDKRIYPVDPPAWIRPSKLGVFTVESRSDIRGDFDPLGISVFKQKVASLPDTILLQLIEQILEQTPRS